MPGGTPNPIHKAKQPQQILPKPIPPSKYIFIVLSFEIKKKNYAFIIANNFMS